MYENVGDKLKKLAMWTAVAEALIAVVSGIALIAEDVIGPGLLLLIFGPIAAYLSSLALYGFGELIEKTSEIAKNTRTTAKVSVTTVSNPAPAPAPAPAEQATQATQEPVQELPCLRLRAADLEDAVSERLQKPVSISEIECTLVYVIPTKTEVPEEMHLDMWVGDRRVTSLELPFFDKKKKAYFWKGRRLALDKAWLKPNEIFDFDVALFKHFRTKRDSDN